MVTRVRNAMFFNNFKLNTVLCSLFVVEPTEPSPVDFEWSQFEKTEKLTYVEDDEVHVKPYNNILSSKNIITVETNRAEDTEKSLTPEDFRQRALMNMMEGVLEKKWEDELKKDVIPPQCIVLILNLNIIIIIV